MRLILAESPTVVYVSHVRALQYRWWRWCYELGRDPKRVLQQSAQKRQCDLGWVLRRVPHHVRRTQRVLGVLLYEWVSVPVATLLVNLACTAFDHARRQHLALSAHRSPLGAHLVERQSDSGASWPHRTNCAERGGTVKPGAWSLRTRRAHPHARPVTVAIGTGTRAPHPAVALRHAPLRPNRQFLLLPLHLLLQEAGLDSTEPCRITWFCNGWCPRGCGAQTQLPRVVVTLSHAADGTHYEVNTTADGVFPIRLHLPSLTFAFTPPRTA